MSQNIPTLEPHVSDLKLANVAFPTPNLQGKDSLFFFSQNLRSYYPETTELNLPLQLATLILSSKQALAFQFKSLVGSKNLKLCVYLCV